MSSITPDYASASTRGPIGRLLDQNHFILRRLHSLTGVVFGLYLFVHLGVNSTLLEGQRHSTQTATIYQMQVDNIHSLPWLKVIEWAFILGPILFHTVYGSWIISSGRPNVGAYGYTRNWLYIFQRATAVILTFFILFHVLSFFGYFPGQLGQDLKFVYAQATESTIVHLQAAWWVGWVVYPIGILAAAFHTANGFYAAAVTWGLTVSKASQKRWAGIAVGAFGFLFVAGMVALIAALTHEPIDPATLNYTH